MKHYLLSSVGSLLISIALVIAVPTLSLPRTVAAGNVTIGEVSFVGTVHGVPVAYNGSVQSTYSQFSTDYPDVVAAHNANNPPVGTLENYYANLNQTTSPESNGIAKRTKGALLCYPINTQDWMLANTDAIQSGISYLQTHIGTYSIQPRSSSRISCSYRAAIWWNNDADTAQTVSWNYLASFAQDIVNSPSRTQYNAAMFQNNTCGQEFDTAGYNIVVRDDGTCQK